MEALLTKGESDGEEGWMRRWWRWRAWMGRRGRMRRRKRENMRGTGLDG